MTPARKTTANGKLPHIVRMCVDGWVYEDDNQTNNFSNAKALLRKALRKSWPTGNRKADITVLPGGFIFDQFPNELKSLKSGWKSQDKDLKTLISYGEDCLQRVLYKTLISRLAERTKYLTIGVDRKNIGHDKTGSKALKCPHFELVAVLKLTKTKAKVVAWTGKSYPTVAQEKSLIQVVDLNTHCVEIDRMKILLLGCHDLNMFSARAWASQRKKSPRRRRCSAMQSIARKFEPTIVIQHPHQTDSSRIWQTAWSGIKNKLPSAQQRLSGIAYYPSPGREELSVVLDRTKFGPKIDDIVLEGF